MPGGMASTKAAHAILDAQRKRTSSPVGRTIADSIRRRSRLAALRSTGTEIEQDRHA